MRKLTATMIVRNEERRLPACLDSLAGVADTLAVVDTGSRDGTLALLAREQTAGRFAVRLAETSMDGFGPARRRALALADTPWSLWIDADERLSAELRDELRRRLADDSLETCDAWRVPVDAHVLGRRMTCRELAGRPHLRLFRTRGATFDDAAVHEGVRLPPGATIGDLAGPLDHHTMTSWREYLRKVEQYTRLEAHTGSRTRAAWHLWIAAPATFWRQYVRRGCVRDGWAGWVWAGTSALGAVMRDARILVRRG
ncbi:MAG: glycosyltransferase family 2 protein [bacterium]|nr:glycosyltransferase family 2 protein [bacterium]